MDYYIFNGTSVFRSSHFDIRGGGEETKYTRIVDLCNFILYIYIIWYVCAACTSPFQYYILAMKVDYNFSMIYAAST